MKPKQQITKDTFDVLRENLICYAYEKLQEGREVELRCGAPLLSDVDLPTIGAIRLFIEVLVQTAKDYHAGSKAAKVFIDSEGFDFYCKAAFLKTEVAESFIVNLTNDIRPYWPGEAYE